MTNPAIKPGDIILADTKGAYGRLIQFGESIRWKQSSRWHHSALVTEVDANGQIWVVQMARRGERVRLENVAPGRTLKVIPCPDNVDTQRVVNFANRVIGTKYGILTIISIAFNILTPSEIRLDIHRNGTLICSAAVARALEHGGWWCPVDPFQITPAQIDQFLGANGWIIDGK